MNKLHALLLSVAVCVGASTVALSHGITKPQHGGVVMMTGETLFEIVQEPAGVALYVLDEDEPVDAKAMTAKLTVSSGGKKSEAPMTSMEKNRFFAKDLKLATGAVVAVLVVDQATKTRYVTTFAIK